MDVTFSKKRQIRGLLFGVIAGLTFAVTAWGVDAWLLARSQAAYPLVKFLPGLIACILAGGLVGWATIRLERVTISLTLWAGLAVFYTWLVIWLPIKGMWLMEQRLQPTLRDLLYYPGIENQYQFAIVSVIVLGFVCIFCGLMEVHLIDQSMLSSGTLPLISPVLISLVLFGIAGTSSDYLINTHFRGPIQAMDDLITFAMENQGKEVSPIVARQKRLSVVKDLDGIMESPRKLTLIAYDRTLGQLDVLVDFDGKWVRCSVIYDQPTMCKRIKYDALRYADDAGKPPNRLINLIKHDKNLTKRAEISAIYQYPLLDFAGKL